jgi:hypothetical protein
MTQTTHLNSRHRLTLPLALGAVAAAVLLAVMSTLVLLRPRDQVSQAVGDLAILVASLVATAGAVRAARRGDASSRGWALMACATGLWSAAQLLWTFYGLTRDQVYPFPSLADAGYIGYAIPAIAGLLLFPRTAERGVSRFRVVLDGLVIAASVLVISWVLVLQSVAHTE